MNANGHAYEDVMDVIDWNAMAIGMSPMLMMAMNQYEINWTVISTGDANLLELLIPIKKYDYVKMKQDNDWLLRELNEYLFEPMRIRKWLEDGQEIEEYLN